MKAKYGTGCLECGRWIHPGDDIEPLEYEPGWVHAKCPAQPRPKCCPLCFMEMALDGSHDCEADR